MRPANVRPWTALQLAAIALGAASALAAPPRSFLDGAYINSFYAAVQPAITGFTNRLPFAAADALMVATVAGLIAFWISAFRAERGLRTVLRVAIGTAALAAAFYIWFLVAWGWNYLRPGFATTLPRESAPLDFRQLLQLEQRIVVSLNAAAPPALAENERRADLAAAMLRARLRTLSSLGIERAVTQTVPKRTLLDPYFDSVGISGMFFPLTFETLLASDLLWFEYPFTLEHEWGHVAGIARESDANFVAAIATLGSRDAVVRYSGLLMVYESLPRTSADRGLSKLVLDDYAAIRRRDSRRVNPSIAKLAWNTYDRYLKSQHVRSGVVNYSEYVHLLLETTLGRSVLSRSLSFAKEPGPASSQQTRPALGSRRGA